jgi:hypothetical protein
MDKTWIEDTYFKRSETTSDINDSCYNKLRAHLPFNKSGENYFSNI